MKTRLLIASLLALLLSACGSGISEDNYQKIENGMTEETVIGILGKPQLTETYGVGSIQGIKATWSNSDSEIVVMFLNGTVKTKRFTAPPGADSATR